MNHRHHLQRLLDAIKQAQDLSQAQDYASQASDLVADSTSTTMAVLTDPVFPYLHPDRTLRDIYAQTRSIPNYPTALTRLWNILISHWGRDTTVWQVAFDVGAGFPLMSLTNIGEGSAAFLQRMLEQVVPDAFPELASPYPIPIAPETRLDLVDDIARHAPRGTDPMIVRGWAAIGRAFHTAMRWRTWGEEDWMPEADATVGDLAEAVASGACRLAIRGLGQKMLPFMREQLRQVAPHHWERGERAR